MISCVVFDFDDTLVWSEVYKKQAFFDIASQFEDGETKMHAIFKNPNRGDRFGIFKLFASDIGKPEKADELSQAYTSAVETHIAKCQEIAGTFEALTALKKEGLALYINSATPEESLGKTVLKRGWNNLFKGIYGGHNQKIENLQKIALQENVNNYNIAMVGDGDNDREAAEKFGCLFIGLEQGLAKYKKPVKLVIKDMTEIVELITGADFERQ
ncbi:MAG: HAD family hydrolase [Alphaproteobacteria bacterium]